MVDAVVGSSKLRVNYPLVTGLGATVALSSVLAGVAVISILAVLKLALEVALGFFNLMVPPVSISILSPEGFACSYVFKGNATTIVLC